MGVPSFLNPPVYKLPKVLQSSLAEQFRGMPQSLNPQVFARRQESTLTPQRRTVGRVLADLVTPKTREGAQWARKVSGALDWTSPTGADQPAQDALTEFRKGNYGTSGALGMLAAASLVPGVGAEAKGGKGLLGKFFEAYHGSPHKFDRFSLDKIGTGEGAQAYGHGLYFAENEDVARQYRNDLTARVAGGANRATQRAGGDIDAAIAKTQEEIARLLSLPNAGGDVSRRDGLVSLQKQRLDELNARKLGQGATGSMYHVRINADPEHFLNWDAPLADADSMEKLAAKFDSVDPVTRRTLEDWSYERQKRGLPMPDGQDIYTHLAGTMESANARATSNLLRDAGIPGISYLDQGSRGGNAFKVQLHYKGQPYGDPLDAASKSQAEELAKEYEQKGFGTSLLDLGTRNHVVFDDSLIEILKRYGVVPPALLGAGAVSQQQGVPQQQNGF